MASSGFKVKCCVKRVKIGSFILRVFWRRRKCQVHCSHRTTLAGPVVKRFSSPVTLPRTYLWYRPNSFLLLRKDYHAQHQTSTTEPSQEKSPTHLRSRSLYSHAYGSSSLWSACSLLNSVHSNLSRGHSCTTNQSTNTNADYCAAANANSDTRTAANSYTRTAPTDPATCACAYSAARACQPGHIGLAAGLN